MIVIPLKLVLDVTPFLFFLKIFKVSICLGKQQIKLGKVLRLIDFFYFFLKK